MSDRDQPDRTDDAIDPSAGQRFRDGSRGGSAALEDGVGAGQQDSRATAHPSAEEDAPAEAVADAGLDAEFASAVPPESEARLADAPESDAEPRDGVGASDEGGGPVGGIVAPLPPEPAQPAWFEDEQSGAASLPRPRALLVPQEAATAAPRVADGAGRRRIGREAVGLAVLAALTAVCVALAVAVSVKTQSDSASAAREAAAFTPSPIASTSPASAGPVIAVVSDETATRASSGTTVAERWPQVLGTRLNARVLPFASAGAGYVTRGADGDTFADLAAAVPAGSDVVVFVGGGSDVAVSASSLALARAATQAFSAAGKQAPDATLVAVGPLYRSSGMDAAALAQVRTVLQSAARVAGVRWVDPVRSNWFPDVASTSDLTPAVERSIASRTEALLGSSAG